MARTPSQNVTFTGASSGDDQFEPPGRAIAAGLREHLQADGFTAAEEDNWRDCGWSIGVAFPGVTLQVALARTVEPDRWLLQVAPLNEPGVLSRLLGRPFVSRESEVLSVSRSIHRWLLDAGYGPTLWCVDGFPEQSNGSAEPVPNGGSAVIV